MVQRDDEPAQNTKSMLQREMAESVVRAQKAINRYAHTRKKLALKGVDPDASVELYDTLTDVDVSTLNAFQLMREYLKNDVPELWNEKVVGYYDGDPVLFGAPPDQELKDDGTVGYVTDLPDDVRFLSEFHNSIERNTEQFRQRFEHKKREREFVMPMLLSIEAYQKTVDLLLRAMKETKFAPQAGIRDIQDDEGLFFEDEPEAPT